MSTESNNKTKGKLIYDGVEYELNDSLRNGLLGYAKNQKPEHQAFYNDILSSMDAGKTVTFNSLGDTDVSIDGEAYRASVLSDRQNNRLAKSKSSLGSFFGSKVNNIRESIYSFNGFNPVKKVAPTPEPERTKIDMSNIGVRYKYDEDGKTRTYIEDAENHKALSRLQELDEYLNLDPDERKKFRLQSGNNDYDISSFEKWLDTDDGLKGDYLTHLTTSIKLGDISEADESNLRALGITFNKFQKVQEEQKEQAQSTGATQAGSTGQAANQSEPRRSYLEGYGSNKLFKDENGNIIWENRPKGRQHVILDGDEFKGTQFQDGVMSDGILYTYEQLNQNKNGIQNIFAPVYADLANTDKIYSQRLSDAIKSANKNNVYFSRMDGDGTILFNKGKHGWEDMDIKSFGEGNIYSKELTDFYNLENAHDRLFAIYNETPNLTGKWGMPELTYKVYKNGKLQDIKLNDLEKIDTGLIRKRDRTMPVEKFDHEYWKLLEPSTWFNNKRKGFIQTGNYKIAGEDDVSIFKDDEGNYYVGDMDKESYKMINKNQSTYLLNLLKTNPSTVTRVMIDDFTSDTESFKQGGKIHKFETGGRYNPNQLKVKTLAEIKAAGGGKTTTRSASLNEIKDEGLDALTSADKSQLAALALDAAALGTSFTGVGAPVASVLGLASTAAQFKSDVDRDGFQMGDLGSAAGSAALDILTFVPGIGTGAKIGKTVKVLRGASRLLGTTFAAMGMGAALTSLNKLTKDGEDFNLDDVRNVLSGLQGLAATRKLIGETRFASKSNDAEISISDATKKNYIDKNIDKVDSKHFGIDNKVTEDTKLDFIKSDADLKAKFDDLTKQGKPQTEAINSIIKDNESDFIKSLPSNLKTIDYNAAYKELSSFGRKGVDKVGDIAKSTSKGVGGFAKQWLWDFSFGSNTSGRVGLNDAEIADLKGSWWLSKGEKQQLARNWRSIHPGAESSYTTESGKTRYNPVLDQNGNEYSFWKSFSKKSRMDGRTVNEPTRTIPVDSPEPVRSNPVVIPVVEPVIDQKHLRNIWMRKTNDKFEVIEKPRDKGKQTITQFDSEVEANNYITELAKYRQKRENLSNELKKVLQLRRNFNFTQSQLNKHEKLNHINALRYNGKLFTAHNSNKIAYENAISDVNLKTKLEELDAMPLRKKGGILKFGGGGNYTLPELLTIPERFMPPKNVEGTKTTQPSIKTYEDYVASINKVLRLPKTDSIKQTTPSNHQLTRKNGQIVLPEVPDYFNRNSIINGDSLRTYRNSNWNFNQGVFNRADTLTQYEKNEILNRKYNLQQKWNSAIDESNKLNMQEKVRLKDQINKSLLNIANLPSINKELSISSVTSKTVEGTKTTQPSIKTGGNYIEQISDPSFWSKYSKTTEQPIKTEQPVSKQQLIDTSAYKLGNSTLFNPTYLNGPQRYKSPNSKQIDWSIFNQNVQGKIDTSNFELSKSYTPSTPEGSSQPKPGVQPDTIKPETSSDDKQKTGGTSRGSKPSEPWNTYPLFNNLLSGADFITNIAGAQRAHRTTVDGINKASRMRFVAPVENVARFDNFGIGAAYDTAAAKILSTQVPVSDNLMNLGFRQSNARQAADLMLQGRLAESQAYSDYLRNLTASKNQANAQRADVMNQNISRDSQLIAAKHASDAQRIASQTQSISNLIKGIQHNMFTNESRKNNYIMNMGESTSRIEAQQAMNNQMEIWKSEFNNLSDTEKNKYNSFEEYLTNVKSKEYQDFMLTLRNNTIKTQAEFARKAGLNIDDTLFTPPNSKTTLEYRRGGILTTGLLLNRRSNRSSGGSKKGSSVGDKLWTDQNNNSARATRLLSAGVLKLLANASRWK